MITNWVQLNKDEFEIEEKVLYFNADNFADLEALIEANDVSTADTKYSGKGRYWYDLRAVTLEHNLKSLLEEVNNLQKELSDFEVENSCFHLGITLDAAILSTEAEKLVYLIETSAESGFSIAILLLYEIEEGIAIIKDNFDGYKEEFKEEKE